MFEQTSAELLKKMLNDVSADYQKTIGFPTYDYLHALAIVLAPITKQLDVVAGKMDIENLEGEELDRFVSERTIVSRRQASHAECVVKITTTDVANIQRGALFETEGGIQFETIEPEYIAVPGEFNLNVRCVTGGIVGNVAANTITKIPKTIQNVVSVNNAQPASGGYEAETDDALRIRYYAQLQTPATSGNVYHYMQWAMNITGVGAAKVFPLWAGNNTVQVVIVDDTMHTPSQALVEEVQDYIDPDITGEGRGVAPIGAYCTVTGATELPINISVEIRKSDIYPSVDIAPAVVDYLRKIAFKQDYVSVGMIGNAIMNTAGVIDYNNLKINNQSANLTIPDKSVAVIGGVNIVYI